jgi:hypothetical protein
MEPEGLVVGSIVALISGIAKRNVTRTMKATSAFEKKLQSIDNGTDMLADLTSSARCAAESDTIKAISKQQKCTSAVLTYKERNR